MQVWFINMVTNKKQLGFKLQSMMKALTKQNKPSLLGKVNARLLDYKHSQKTVVFDWLDQIQQN